MTRQKFDVVVRHAPPPLLETIGRWIAILFFGGLVITIAISAVVEFRVLETIAWIGLGILLVVMLLFSLWRTYQKEKGGKRSAWTRRHAVFVLGALVLLFIFFTNGRVV